MQIITFIDFLILPLYLLLFTFFAKRMAKSQKDPGLRKYLMVAFFLRMFGAIAYSLIVQYYYGYGDSMTFFRGSSFFVDQFKQDFSNISYLFSTEKELESWYNIIEGDPGFVGYFTASSGNMIMKISAVLSIFAFNRYIIIALFFGFFSFAGQWKLFRVFDYYNEKQNRKLLAFAVLYSPTIWFWGSGLMKDSICLGAMGFIIYFLHKYFIRKEQRVIDLLLAAVLVSILIVIKSYIIAVMAIGIALFILWSALKKIANKVIRVFIVAGFLLFGSVILYAINFSSMVADIAQESYSQIIYFQQNYQAIEEEPLSGLGLTELDPSPASLAVKSPLVVFMTIFRPFLWDSTKIFNLFAALETTTLLFCTLYIMFKWSPVQFFKKIFASPFLVFCWTLTMLFAMIVGFTTYNMGTMIRYKMVLLPFLYFMLVRLYTLNKAAANKNLTNTL